MYVLSSFAIFVAIFGIGDSLLRLGGGGGGALGNIGGAAGGLIGGAEGVLGGAGSKIGGLLHGNGHKNNIPFNPFENSSSEEHKQNHGRGKKTGRGIDRHSGIGSRDGIATPILNLLGLTKAVCHVSYAGEAAIEKIGDFAIGMNYEVRKLDHAIANYITDNIVLKAVEAVRRGHNDVIKFIVGTHVGFTKFATNTIIEIYRATKAPIRELLACH